MSGTTSERQAIYDHIDAHLDDHVERLRTFIRQPSVSNTGEGIDECAELTRRFLEELGCQRTEIAPPGRSRTGAMTNPVVYGEYDAGAEKTLLVYMMYDTMPTYDPALWKADPLAGEIIEQPPFKSVMIGRGATNSKGPHMALLNALMSIKAVAGELPVNLLFVAEGDEERMSIGLHEFIHANVDRLRKADAMLGWGWQTIDGSTRLQCGSEGCIYFELTTSGAAWGRGPGETAIHGIYKRIVDSVAWRHVQMLNTLTADNGNTILVEGWHDNIQPPTTADNKLIDAMVEDINVEDSARRLGIGGFIPGKSRRELLVDTIYGTSLNMDGIWGGLTTAGTAGSIMPHTVTSKHNCRYVPDQDGRNLLAKVRAHLDRHGYQDVQMSVIGDVPWVIANYETDIARAFIRTCQEFGVEYHLIPGVGVGGFGPYWPAYLFARDPLQLPILMGSIGHGARAHMIDEYYVIEGNDKVYGLAGAEKGYVSTLYEYAGGSRQQAAGNRG
jgi:acetylornithine deacetylase/succinyl-diaminopimelate desuccinylase-like protein